MTQQSGTPSPPPGLFLFRGALSAEACETLVKKSVALYHELTALCEGLPLESAQIPQPDFVTSQEHNLTTEERFVRLRPRRSDTETMRCEFFPEYGSKGHALAYFRGNRHIPDFIEHHVTDVLRGHLADVGLLDEGQEPEWRLTMNVYHRFEDTISGFPFHVDIHANGIVTTILNVQHRARFEIVRHDGEEPLQRDLEDGDMLVLSGESRYEWKHRVLPMRSQGEDGEIARISLVLGLT